LDHEVIVAHARNVRLIGESSRKDDRLDARTLARLARIDPGLLGPVRYRSAKAQIHLTVNRARTALVSTRTALVKCRPRVDEILWRAAAEVRHVATESRDRQGTGTAASRAWRKECQEASRRCGGRKLAVLLHRLSVSGEVYKPLRNNHKMVSAVA
jgi:hypothetical protein